MVLSTTNPPADAGVKKTPVKKKKKATKKQVSSARDATVLAMEEAITTTLPSGATKRNFSPPEDAFLCQAFVSVSLNPMKGVGMKGDEFWRIVKAKFDALQNSMLYVQSMVRLNFQTNGSLTGMP